MTDPVANQEPKHYPYQFNNTEIIFAANKERHGIVSLMRPEEPIDLIREKPTGKLFALNLYRIMNEGALQGYARTEPFTVLSVDEHGIVLRWEPTPAHPIKMEAAYTFHENADIDLVITIEATIALSKHELSLSSYYDFVLEPYAIIPTWPGKTADADMQLVKMEDHPYIKGHYVLLPRDTQAVLTSLDGRWTDQKTGKPIANHVFGPIYGRAIAIMASQNVHIIQMTEPDQCAGVGITYSSDDKNDSIFKHNAIYFTLFGDDLQPGDKRQARIRQVIRSGKPELNEILKLYDAFIRK